MSDEHKFIETPGPLDQPNEIQTATYSIYRGKPRRRWVCSCGATGNWVTGMSWETARFRHDQHRERVLNHFLRAEGIIR